MSVGLETQLPVPALWFVVPDRRDGRFATDPVRGRVGEKLRAVFDCSNLVGPYRITALQNAATDVAGLAVTLLGADRNSAKVELDPNQAGNGTLTFEVVSTYSGPYVIEAPLEIVNV